MGRDPNKHPAEGNIPPNPNGGLANETPTIAQRTQAKAPETLDEGPKINDANGAYLPASYVSRSGSIRTDN